MAFVLVTIALIGVLIPLGRFCWNNIRRRLFLRGVPHIEGPNRLLYGHMPLISDGSPGSFHLYWHGKHGPVISYDGFFNRPRVSIADKVALHHILSSHHLKFPKPVVGRRMVASLLGEGLVFAEGADHARQRRIMSPAFGPAHIKAVFSIFSEKALHLRDILMAKTTECGEVPTELNFCPYASRVSLDVIASAGFGYETDAIERGNDSELARSFSELSNVGQPLRLFQVLVHFFPTLRHLPDSSKRGKAMKNAVSTMRRIGRELVGRKVDAALAQSTQNGDIEHEHLAGKDLLSILVKANMAKDLKPSQRLTDDEVMAQISTFLLAGSGTTRHTSTMMSMMYALCKDHATQDKLRAEVVTVSSDHPTYEELNSLQYLDAVVRETLRLYSPFVAAVRTATEDSVIPLSEPIIKPNGSKNFALKIAKGTDIEIPLHAMANDPVVWGSDINEFKPERWLSPNGVPDGATEMPSLKFPTFLAGPRACIGFRFSVMEIKIVLFSLVRVMSFELAVDPDEIELISGFVTRPRIKSRPEAGWQLPVLVRAL